MKKNVLISVILISFVAITNAQWQKISQFPINGAVWSLAVSGNNIFAGTDGSGVYLSSNNGDSWIPVNSGLTNQKVTSLVPNGNSLFATTKGGVFVSSNNGLSWTKLSTGLTDTLINSLVINGDKIFVGTASSGVYLSTNNGNNWVSVNNGLTNLFTFSLALRGNNIFVSTYGGVFLSTDNGGSWKAVNSGLPIDQCQIEELVINDKAVYTVAYGKGLYYSTNNGNSWAKMNKGFANSSYFNTISLLSLIGDSIFVGTSDCSGMYFSPNNGANWDSINIGLPCSYEYCLIIDKTFVYLGTDNGLYKRVFSEITGFESIYKNENKISEYPNPTDNIITLKLREINDIENTLSIYNIQGQIILQQPINQLKTNINVSRLSKGIYILKLQYGDNVEIKKILKK